MKPIKRPTRTGYWVGSIAFAIIGAMLAFAFFGASPSQVPANAPRDAIAELQPAIEARTSPISTSPEPDDPADALDADEGQTDFSLFDRDVDIAMRWARVDLDAVRAAMPDNVYWKLGAPTSDAVLLRERAEERARWNEEFGKVLSGNATEAEIDAYYEQRHRLSADYVEFGSHLIEHYGDVLPARDVGLLELSVKMHHARLQQMPRRLTEAIARKKRQDRLRAEWLADEAAFEQEQADRAHRAQR